MPNPTARITPTTVDVPFHKSGPPVPAAVLKITGAVTVA
jgi:hypothetical protein